MDEEDSMIYPFFQRKRVVRSLFDVPHGAEVCLTITLDDAPEEEELPITHLAPDGHIYRHRTIDDENGSPLVILQSPLTTTAKTTTRVWDPTPIYFKVESKVEQPSSISVFTKMVPIKNDDDEPTLSRSQRKSYRLSPRFTLGPRESCMDTCSSLIRILTLILIQTVLNPISLFLLFAFFSYYAIFWVVFCSFCIFCCMLCFAEASVARKISIEIFRTSRGTIELDETTFRIISRSPESNISGPLDSIGDVCCEREVTHHGFCVIDNRTFITYNVCIFKKNAPVGQPPMAVFRDLKTMEEALFIEQEIERRILFLSK